QILRSRGSHHLAPRYLSDAFSRQGPQVSGGQRVRGAGEACPQALGRSFGQRRLAQVPCKASPRRGETGGSPRPRAGGSGASVAAPVAAGALGRELRTRGRGVACQG